jgi:hypothetical protein
VSTSPETAALWIDADPAESQHNGANTRMVAVSQS